MQRVAITCSPIARAFGALRGPTCTLFCVAKEEGIQVEATVLWVWQWAFCALCEAEMVA